MLDSFNADYIPTSQYLTGLRGGMNGFVLFTLHEQMSSSCHMFLHFPLRRFTVCSVAGCQASSFWNNFRSRWSSVEQNETIAPETKKTRKTKHRRQAQTRSEWCRRSEKDRERVDVYTETEVDQHVIFHISVKTLLTFMILFLHNEQVGGIQSCASAVRANCMEASSVVSLLWVVFQRARKNRTTTTT